MNRAKRYTATALTAAALALTAAPATVHADQFTATDRAYLRDLAAEQRGSIGGTDRAKTELGIATCGALRTNPVQDVVEVGVESGFSGYDVGALIGAASINYCPDTWAAVQAWAANV